MMQQVVRQREGYSLVELMAGMLAATVLALTIGTMLFHAYDAWDENHAAVNLHRDGQNAMDLMTRAIRNAAVTNIVTAVNNNLVVQDVAAGRTVRFWRAGRRLQYDPDIGTGGDTVELIEAPDVVRFLVTPTATAIGIRLDLERGEERIRLDSVVAYRN